jgi:hypothetical protein
LLEGFIANIIFNACGQQANLCDVISDLTEIFYLKQHLFVTIDCHRGEAEYRG